MKLYGLSLTLLLTLSLVACDEEASDSEASDSEESDVTSSMTTQSVDEGDDEKLDPLSDPCVITGEEMSAITAWQDISDGMPNLINGELFQVCDYNGSQNGLQIAFTRYDDQYIDSKWLEENFASEVGDPDVELTYDRIEAGFGDETLFIHGQEKLSYRFLLKWRIGNHTMKEISSNSGAEADTDDMLRKFKAIAARLEQ